MTKATERRRRRQRAGTWQFRGDMHEAREWTAIHLPTGRRVPVGTYEMLGGIVSGRVRLARARKRARRVRRLYRAGHDREFIMGWTGCSRRTFFRCLAGGATNYCKDFWREGEGVVTRRLYARLMPGPLSSGPDFGRFCPMCGQFAGPLVYCGPCGNKRTAGNVVRDWEEP